jgi:hypothetical protein
MKKGFRAGCPILSAFCAERVGMHNEFVSCRINNEKGLLRRSLEPMPESSRFASAYKRIRAAKRG